MTHGYTLLWAGLFSTWELVTTRDWWRRVGALTAIHGLAILLMAFWLFPLLAYAPYTTSYSPRLDHQELAGDPSADPVDPDGHRARDAADPPRAGGVRHPAVPVVSSASSGGRPAIGILFYFTAKAFHVVDIRFFPFMQLGFCLCAAVGLGMLLAMLPAPEIWPLDRRARHPVRTSASRSRSSPRG